MMTDDHPSDPGDEHGYRPTRRIVFSGLASLGVAVALAGCGSSSDSGSGSAGGSSSGGSSSSGPGSSSPTAAAGKELAKTSDIPVNGGMILTDQKIVITQPTAGTYEAFSAVCTHQGFLVGEVSKNVILCEHHGSEFSAQTGKVERGPAQKALSKVEINVQGTSILKA